MSRGYGYVQRFVLAELDERWAAGNEWIVARALAERLESGPPTRRVTRSVRRALRRLAADGLVEMGARDRMFVRIAPASAGAVAERRARRARARDARHALGGIRNPFPIDDQGAHTHVAPVLSVRARP
jgi:DNA-binding FadR family transcriptional regulator